MGSLILSSHSAGSPQRSTPPVTLILTVRSLKISLKVEMLSSTLRIIFSTLRKAAVLTVNTGLKNIMDINADMWSDGTAIKPTKDGKKYTPTLKAFTSARTFKEAQIDDPWEVEVVFGDNGKRVSWIPLLSAIPKPTAASELPIKYQVTTGSRGAKSSPK